MTERSHHGCGEPGGLGEVRVRRAAGTVAAGTEFELFGRATGQQSLQRAATFRRRAQWLSIASRGGIEKLMEKAA